MRSETICSPARPERLSQLVSSVLGAEIAPRMDANQRAAGAWFAANGDRERAHTTRVYLRRPRTAALAPVICVLVDSHAFACDLSANRDLYLARLANQGFRVSGIEFMVDREAPRGRTGREGSKEGIARGGKAGGQDVRADVPQELEAFLAQLSPTLRKSASKAVINSLSRTDK